MPNLEFSYVEDAEPDAQLSRAAPERRGVDLPVKQAVAPGRKLLPGTAFPQRLRTMHTTLVQKSIRVYR